MRNGLRKRFSFLMVSGLALGSLLLVGCVMEAPVVSERKVSSNSSLDELQTWVVDEVDAVMEATGVSSEWLALGWDEEARWIGDREWIFEATERPQCTFNAGEANPASVEVILATGPLKQDPFVLLEQVREMWIADGWEVHNLYEPEQIQVKMLDIVARRSDGSMMMLGASDVESAKELFLTVNSVCSNHSTVAW
ncbi:MAG: hypothetical protein AB7V10_01335 [Leucobacter sp.]